MLLKDIYKVPATNTKGVFKEKGSKFIAYLYAVKSEENVKNRLAEVKKIECSARHFCYAFVINPDKSVQKVNDDGEPNNSAGKPILGQIKSNDLTNILIIVVRYFGGIKLGFGGLINAYRSAASEALLDASIEEKFIQDVYDVKFEYSQMNDVMRLIKELDLNVLKQDFKIRCLLQFSIRKSQSKKTVEAFQMNHKLIIEFNKTI